MNPDDVVLHAAKGVRGKGGFYWHIMVHGKRAGKVFINWLEDDDLLGPHASIQIFLNKTAQGKGIGRIAYAKACIASSYDVIYAHMRKSNLASIIAAKHAGFVTVLVGETRQMVMQWHRPL